MSELYLIAHKVRGEPAFDVATQMECPICNGGIDPMCIECDEVGYWWIIPTSGHRAYPYFYVRLDKLKMYFYGQDGQWVDRFDLMIEAMPPDLPDHYRTRAEPKLDLTSILGLIHAPLAPIKRRF